MVLISCLLDKRHLGEKFVRVEVHMRIEDDIGNNVSFIRVFLKESNTMIINTSESLMQWLKIDLLSHDW